MIVEAKLQELGIVLPAALVAPAGLSIPFAWARRYDDRVYLSGHGPLGPDGSPLGPFGKVGAEVSLAQAQQSAIAALAAPTLTRTLEDLDRLAAWLTVSGMVNVAPGFAQTTDVINPCSEILIKAFGEEVGRHARTAIGMAQLPLNFPVVIAAQVAVSK